MLPTVAFFGYRVPPLTFPLTAVAVMVAVAVLAGGHDALGRRVGRAVASFWVLFVASLTLTPAVPLWWQVKRGPVVTCELVPRIGSLGEFFATGDDWLNVLLYIPLGLLVLLLAAPGRRRRWYAVLLAAPILVETFQGLAASFYRSCAVKDVLTNALGVLLGAGVGAAVRAAATARVRSREQSSASAGTPVGPA